MKKFVKYIEWDDKFKVDIKIIDKQHKHFIGIINKLFLTLQSDKKDAVAKIIDELADHTDLHFATEEAFFDKYQYPDAKQHKDEHAKIRVRIIKFLSRKNQDPLKTGYDLLDLLEEWLLGHLIKMDREYAKFFKQQGLR